MSDAGPCSCWSALANPLAEGKERGGAPRRARRDLRRSDIVGREQEHTRPPDAQDLIRLVQVRRRNPHPGAVTRRHEHRVRVAGPHVPCAVSRLQASTQRQTDTATDRAPENAERVDQGAERHEDQRRHSRRCRGQPEERCQWRPQYYPRDGGIAPAQPRGERDPASYVVRQRSDWRRHFAVSALARGQVLEGQLAVHAHVSGQPEHALGDDIAQDLVGARGDARARR
jgi:hypothetical protein